MEAEVLLCKRDIERLLREKRLWTRTETNILVSLKLVTEKELEWRHYGEAQQ